jgi:hypothetical protein
MTMDLFAGIPVRDYTVATVSITPSRGASRRHDGVVHTACADGVFGVQAQTPHSWCRRRDISCR